MNFILHSEDYQTPDNGTLKRKSTTNETNVKQTKSRKMLEKIFPKKSEFHKPAHKPIENPCNYECDNSDDLEIIKVVKGLKDGHAKDSFSPTSSIGEDDETTSHEDELSDLKALGDEMFLEIEFSKAQEDNFPSQESKQNERSSRSEIVSKKTATQSTKNFEKCFRVGPTYVDNPRMNSGNSAPKQMSYLYEKTSKKNQLKKPLESTDSKSFEKQYSKLSKQQLIEKLNETKKQIELKKTKQKQLIAERNKLSKLVVSEKNQQFPKQVSKDNENVQTDKLVDELVEKSFSKLISSGNCVEPLEKNEQQIVELVDKASQTIEPVAKKNHKTAEKVEEKIQNVETIDKESQPIDSIETRKQAVRPTSAKQNVVEEIVNDNRNVQPVGVLPQRNQDENFEKLMDCVVAAWYIKRNTYWVAKSAGVGFRLSHLIRISTENPNHVKRLHDLYMQSDDDWFPFQNAKEIECMQKMFGSGESKKDVTMAQLWQVPGETLFPYDDERAEEHEENAKLTLCDEVSFAWRTGKDTLLICASEKVEEIEKKTIGLDELVMWTFATIKVDKRFNFAPHMKRAEQTFDKNVVRRYKALRGREYLWTTAGHLLAGAVPEPDVSSPWLLDDSERVQVVEDAVEAYKRADTKRLTEILNHKFPLLTDRERQKGHQTLADTARLVCKNFAVNVILAHCPAENGLCKYCVKIFD